jgi:hypothetical protein
LARPQTNPDAEAWDHMQSGSVIPNPIEIGKTVMVGSITSRTFWRTTEVTEIVEDVGKKIVFKTANSTYRVLWLD